MKFYFDNEHARLMMEEERKLLNEVSKQPMSWKKITNAIKLNAMLRANYR